MAEYYTPTLEELLTFIVNEKYCYAPSKSGNMIFKVDFKSTSFANALKSFIEGSDYDSEKGFSINPKVNRLKYLDKEDIKSLGWQYYKTLPGTTIMVYEIKDYELWYDSSRNHVAIEMKGEGDKTIFTGKIKNISELKIILKLKQKPK